MGDTFQGVLKPVLQFAAAVVGPVDPVDTRLRVVHKSTGRIGGAQIDRADLLGAEMEAEDAILVGWPQRERLAAACFADAETAALEADYPVGVDLAHDVIGTVLDLWQMVGEGARADAITTAGDVDIERLMRPLVVVDMPPDVKGALTFGQIAKVAYAENLSVERAMKALVLALGLRMISVKIVKGCAPAVAPRRTILHQHDKWQPVASKHSGETRTDGQVLLVATGFHRQGITRVVVNHRERMA